MPTITFSHKDFNELLSKKTTVEELKILLEELHKTNGGKKPC